MLYRREKQGSTRGSLDTGRLAVLNADPDTGERHCRETLQRDRGIPLAHWSANLTKSANPKPMRDPIPKSSQTAVLRLMPP